MELNKMDIYEKAYKKSSEMLADSDDLFLQEMLPNLSDDDYGTLHDRLADIYVASQIETLGNVICQVQQWLLLNTKLTAEQIINLKSHILTINE